jgi:hypothetical protein
MPQRNSLRSENDSRTSSERNNAAAGPTQPTHPHRVAGHAPKKDTTPRRLVVYLEKEKKFMTAICWFLFHQKAPNER